MQALLEVRDLKTHFFTSEGVVRAANGVSFDLLPKQSLSIVGESGCGKTVTMLSILRLIRPPGNIIGGEAFFQGRDLLQMSKGELRAVRGKEIAMIFQEPMTSLNPVLSIGFQISEALRWNEDISRRQAQDRTIELLDRVGIPDAASRYDEFPHQFSGGMRQRAMIAMALSCSPSILIADEPTTALDVTIQAQIVDLVKGLREEFGMAIIWITHDLGLVAELADKVIVMYAGHVVERADIYQLFSDPRHPYTYALLGSLPQLSDDPGIDLMSIPGSPPNLIDEIEGCPFAPRCPLRFDRCDQERPDLMLMDTHHESACWAEAARVGFP